MKPKPPEIADRPVRILVVDDQCDNRELLEIILGWEGFFVLTATCGAEALSTAEQKPFDLVLLDIMMPDMNGYQVLAKLKDSATTKHIPVMLLSGLADRAAKLLGVSAGAEDFLAKPLQRETLVARVKSLLRKTYADYHET
jgi:two-component system cell cycle response regulator